jgi:hypothetical protein
VSNQKVFALLFKTMYAGENLDSDFFFQIPKGPDIMIPGSEIYVNSLITNMG